MPADLDLTFLRDQPVTRAATRFARERHAGQRRDADRASFLLHPLEVASLLQRSGYPDSVIAAAVLHDVLENTDAEQADLASRFGPEVCELVALVSDDPTLPSEEQRKDEVRDRVRRAGGHALVVYAADKISKVRELRTLLASGLDQREGEIRSRRHWRSLEMLEQTNSDNRLVELLRFELEALRELPPASPPS